MEKKRQSISVLTSAAESFSEGGTPRWAPGHLVRAAFPSQVQGGTCGLEKDPAMLGRVV